MAFFYTGLVVFGWSALGTAFACSAFKYGMPAFRRWRESVRRTAEEKKAEDERRWQLLRPFFVSGAITQFDFTLDVGSFWKIIRLRGPEFSAECKEYSGTSAVNDPQKLLKPVQEALSTPGTKVKGMRHVARVLVQAIRRDKGVLKLYDDVRGNSGNIQTKGSEQVTQFRKLA